MQKSTNPYAMVIRMTVGLYTRMFYVD